MPDAIERIMNVAFAFANAHSPLTAEDIRDQVEGYPEGQDAAAFARMFERDKEDLRRSGFVIAFDEAAQVYSLDRSSTFAAPLELTAQEAATLRIAGAALLEDPSFPFTRDLRLALAKLSADGDRDDAPVPTRLADEHAELQGEVAASLADAADRRKRARFGYTNTRGLTAEHEIEPYGLFLRDGRWYAVGRDTALDETRTYAVARIADLTVNETAPRTPDFERPDDFDVVRFIRLPFEYGPEDAFEATIRFEPDSAWRASALTCGHGSLTRVGDALDWRITARSTTGLLRFVLENGPGLSVSDPPELAVRLRKGLAEVEALHG